MAEALTRRLSRSSDFTVHLQKLVGGQLEYSHQLEYSSQDLQQAMGDENSTTLTGLCINVAEFNPSNLQEQNLLQFLCHYISSRRHLHKLTLQSTILPPTARRPRCPKLFSADVVESFVAAAANSETIHCLVLRTMADFPVEVLRNFHSIHNPKVLKIGNVSFCSSQDNGTDRDLHSLPEQSAALDKLILTDNGIDFRNPQAELEFIECLGPRMECKGLELGLYDYRDFPTREVSALLLSRLIVKHLTLPRCCHEASFRNVATNRMDSVEDLCIVLAGGDDSLSKFQILKGMISGMPKLKVFHLTLEGPIGGLRPGIKKEFLRAIDACSTITSIQVDDDEHGNFSQQESQLLQDG